MSEGPIISSPLSHCFPPVGGAMARALILGSFPGAQSLEKSQYYAHPRNAFWAVMARLLGFEEDLPYPAKLEWLERAGLALWDVLQSCERPGSLDVHIRSDTIKINDFNTFFNKHPHIRTIFFNGTKAESEFIRRVVPKLVLPAGSFNLIRLPSTSPAMASLSFEDKVHAWSKVVACLTI